MLPFAPGFTMRFIFSLKEWLFFSECLPCTPPTFSHNIEVPAFVPSGAWAWDTEPVQVWFYNWEQKW